MRQCQDIVAEAKKLFMQKYQDYGTSWRVLRDISIVDQLYIKLKRICTLQEKKVALVQESIHLEWIAVINYGVVGLIQHDLTSDDPDRLDVTTVEKQYDKQMYKALELMQCKNHDYGEAWREMSLKSIADICLVKANRMRHMLEHKESQQTSEGIDANYVDLINYAIFSLIIESRATS